ncbi:MAG: serine hydrolase domain-containing protein [Rikenellaceae bacterium]
MKKILLVAIIFISITHLGAQPLERVFPSEVGLDRDQLSYADKAIEKQIELGNIPGAVLAVVKDGKMAYVKSFGKTSYQKQASKMSEHTIFDIASCTKSVATAVAAMILIERGELSLRDNVDNYIKDFNKNKIFEEKHYRVYVKNLMTHTSGLPPYVTMETLKENYDTLNRAAVIDYAKTTGLRYIPGDGFKYSCINYIVLQQIIEQISGQSLRDFAKENIFAPLKMNHTDYLPLGNKTSKAWAKKKDIAPSEQPKKKPALVGIVHDPLAREINEGISGNAGVFSTAEDLAVFCAMILNNGKYHNTKILSPLAVRTMTSVPKNLSEFGRAPGWDVSSPFSSNMGDLFALESFGHTGTTGCSITLDKENNMAIILLTNATLCSEYEAKNIVNLRSRVANCVAASIEKLP